MSNLADLAYDAIEDGEAYYAEDLCVLGEYAVYTQEESSGEDQQWKYYLLCFEDKDGEAVYASLQVEPDTPLGKKCNDYIKDDSMEIGDLMLDGVFSCEALSEQPNAIVGYYEEMYNEALDVIGQGEDIRMNFTYEAEDEAAYLEQQEESAIAMLVVGLVFTVGSAIGLFFLIRRRKKIKEMEANQTNFDGGYPGDMNGGYPGNMNGGYPGNVNGGYPGNVNGGYPGNMNGGYPGNVNGGYPGNVNGGYPGNVNGGYPGNVNGGYPGNVNGGYPGNVNGGYPGNVNGGYPGNVNGGYPGNVNGGYPGNVNGGYPGNNGGYNNPTNGQ